MKKGLKENYSDVVFSADNADNIRSLIGRYKNVLVCGVKGVGKITETVKAVKNKTNVYYIGNPVDYEGKNRPGSYEKYIKYILSLKDDLKIVDDETKLYKVRSRIILIVDEIYGRSDSQLEKISRIFDMENVQVFQIVGCLKNMGNLIEKIDIILELHLDGSFIISRELGRAICRIFGKK